MPQRDRLLRVSDQQALTSGTIFSTDHIPLAQIVGEQVGAGPDMGTGNPLWFEMHIDESFVGGTSLMAEVVVAVTALNDGSAIAIGSTGIIPIVDPLLAAFSPPSPLQAGENHYAAWGPVDRIAKVPFLPLVGANFSSYRIVGMRYTMVGTFSLGKVTTCVVERPVSKPKLYPSGYRA